MREHFFSLIDSLAAGLGGPEVLLASYSGEESDFVRFNHAKVRQAGSVRQGYVSLELIGGKRHARATVGVAGDAGTDLPRLTALLGALRDRLPHVPEDPYLLYATEPVSGEQVGEDRLPDAADAVDAVLAAGAGRDMVGLYAAGGIFAGFANSLGQRNWFASYSYHVDWSFYLAADKAVKSTFAGFDWDAGALARKAEEAAGQLEMLALPARTLQPGGYRVYLAPEATAELLGTLSWGGFGLKAHRTKTTSLLKMIEGGAALHPSVMLRENTRDGLAANFDSAGFIKPDCVTLIEAGRFRDCLVSPRSAAEYGVPTNGAGAGEAPASLDMAGGSIPPDGVLAELDTGIYASQLHYLNYSDRPGCRITGMTRFATFWVEGGRIVAPLNVMRFDETVYRALGENLLGLTDQAELIPSTSTYGGRSTASVRAPGALIEDFRLVL
ncbi:MAG TPA: metallopeptidase TldD-related protein [Phycisphaerae bacterium]|nr:metallopeptidase TldD-related protein [Phycisphaerae bacterium]